MSLLTAHSPTRRTAMAVEVAVTDSRVESIRRALDHLADMPPTVGKNEALPSYTFLTYERVRDEAGFIITAMQNGASCSRS